MDPRIYFVIGIVTCSWIIGTYYDYAVQKGLPVGKFFLPDKGKNFKLFSIIVGLYFIVAGSIDFGWYFFLIIPIGSFILAFSLTRVLGKHVQILGIVGFILLVFANILLQIEGFSV